MSASDVLIALAPVGLKLAQLGLDAAMGKRPTSSEVAREAVDLAMLLVPREELVAYLTQGGIERGEIAGDVAEVFKFESTDLDEL